MSLFDKKGKNIQEKLKAKLKDVIKKFIPSKYRSVVWPKVETIPYIISYVTFHQLIGNKLKISKAYYKELHLELQSNPLPKEIRNLIGIFLIRA